MTVTHNHALQIASAVLQSTNPLKVIDADKLRTLATALDEIGPIDEPGPDRIAMALESIAKSLERMAHPLLTGPTSTLHFPALPPIPADQASIAARIIATDNLDAIPDADFRSLAGWVLDKVDADGPLAKTSDAPPNSIRHGARAPGAHPRDRRP